MPKYLTVASYTAEGAKGLLKEGGSARRAVVETMMKSIGGKLELILVRRRPKTAAGRIAFKKYCYLELVARML
jgi:hypothetical protein